MTSSSPAIKKPSTKRFRSKAPHRTPRPLAKPRSTSPGAYFAEERSRSASPISTQNKTEKANTTSPTNPNPNTGDNSEEEFSFSTALFESLSSTEAAAYWAGVYGQRLDIYARPWIESRSASDAEYAAYVQQRVWENTREGLEDGARRRKATRAAEAKEQAAQREREKKQREQDRREEERWEREREREEDEREEALWNNAARLYVDAWNRDVSAGDRERRILWPWIHDGDDEDEESGFSSDDVKTFLRHVADLQGVALEQQLRIERVRWHPDKIVQRFGGEGAAVTSDIMARVNEVWRIIDALWKAAGKKKRKE